MPMGLTLASGWALDGFKPDRGDVVGSVIALSGVLVIMLWPRDGSGLVGGGGSGGRLMGGGGGDDDSVTAGFGVSASGGRQV